MHRFKNLLFLVTMVTFSIFSINVAHADSTDITKYITESWINTSAGREIKDGDTLTDSSSYEVSYIFEIPNSVDLKPGEEYTFEVAPEFKYQTGNSPIIIDSIETGQRIGTVEIKDGKGTIVFDQLGNDVSMSDVAFGIAFWTGIDTSKLDYDKGNDILLPNENDPKNTLHVNWKKSNRNSTGQSMLSKQISYNKDDPTDLTWQIVVNNAEETYDEAIIRDTFGKGQEYVPGSMTINYRNARPDRKSVKRSTEDPTIKDNGDGTQSFLINLGPLHGVDETPDKTAPTSAVITYKTKITDEGAAEQYKNTVQSFDEDELVDTRTSTATWRGSIGTGDMSENSSSKSSESSSEVSSSESSSSSSENSSEVSSSESSSSSSESSSEVSSSESSSSSSESSSEVSSSENSSSSSESSSEVSSSESSSSSSESSSEVSSSENSSSSSEVSSSESSSSSSESSSEVSSSESSSSSSESSSEVSSSESSSSSSESSSEVSSSESSSSSSESSSEVSSSESSSSSSESSSEVSSSESSSSSSESSSEVSSSESSSSSSESSSKNSSNTDAKQESAFDFVPAEQSTSKTLNNSSSESSNGASTLLGSNNEADTSSLLGTNQNNKSTGNHQNFLPNTSFKQTVGLGVIGALLLGTVVVIFNKTRR
ncbi:hypothetical protein JK159_01790 [Weissella minor]|uniref:collagen binding domain-containing protein n=1 Tax=Weissella minor TaxID=1620 RepID=UPI001BB042D5|nr:collagen binding domain-containing protein [Weissella minor]MBS0949114.1 hypothetical protein [Weissella minor]